MQSAAERFQREIPQWFPPGGIYTFVGAGGKSTAMRKAASLIASTGVRVRMTTTTRVGIAEFASCPVALVSGLPEAQRAVDQPEPILLVASAVLQGLEKYGGVDPGLVDGLRLAANTVLLVEGDGSRRLPLKVPREREPVIPSRSHAVLAFLGAQAIDEPVDPQHCYNHERALALLGRSQCVLGAEEIAVLASHPEGSRKGVLPGMSFRLVISQGDLPEKRQTALSAMRIVRERSGIEAALASFQEGELYAAAAD